MVGTGKAFKFPSSSSSQVYTTRINDDGLLSCDCRGWTVKKLNKPRECKHTKQVGQGLQLVERAGQWYVVNGQTPAPVVAAQATPMNGFVNPMLASAMPDGASVDDYSDGFVMEEKFDGIRLVLRAESGVVRAWSRLGNTKGLAPHLYGVVTELPDGVYDGELILTTSLRSAGAEALVLFDCLEVRGQSLMKEPLSGRRRFLDVAFSALPTTDAVRLAPQFKPRLRTVKAIWAAGGEGAIIKRLSATYTPGWRSPDWIKVKAAASATLTIVGFTAAKLGPYSTINIRDKDGNETTVKLPIELMRQAEAKPEAFIGKPVVISYQERLPSGKYRHPMFDHIAGIGEMYR